jgi:hypothetical protein
LFIFRLKAIESLTKELNIVDQDLKQMTKRQKCSLSNVNIPTNTNSKQIIDDNPILSTIDVKEESSSTTTGNDNVPNWIQPGGQVRLTNKRKNHFAFCK